MFSLPNINPPYIGPPLAISPEYRPIKFALYAYIHPRHINKILWYYNTKSVKLTDHKNNLTREKVLFLKLEKDKKKKFAKIKERKLKIRLWPFKKYCLIFFNENTVKMMKNAFYFILKARFVLKIFKVLSWLCGHIEKMGW